MLKNILKTSLLWIVSIVATLSLCVRYDVNEGIVIFQNANNFIWIFFAMAFYYFINKTIQIDNKRLKIVAIILAILLSAFSVVGSSIHNYLNLDEILISKKAFMQSIIKFSGLCVTIYLIVVLLYDFLDREKNENKKTFFNLFTDNKKSFFVVLIIIFIFRIPYFLRFFPGILTPDSLDQLRQALHLFPINNHHPAFHTLVIRWIVNFGNLIFNYKFGVILFFVMQMLFGSAVFSYSIYYMAKKGVPTSIRIIAFLYYLLYTVHAMYSITMWKDVPFAIIMLLFTIVVTEAITNEDNFFKYKRNIVSIIIVSMLLILFRNNGLYVFLITVPFFMIATKKHIKSTVFACAGVLLLFIIWNNVCMPVMNIKKGNIREALSVPLQQIARVCKNKNDFIEEEQKNKIQKYFPVEDLGELYDPKLSDPVKSTFDSNYFKENKMDFIMLWTKLFFRFPREYVESFLCNSYGYWYPEFSNWVVSRETSKSDVKEIQDISLEQTPIIRSNLIDELIGITEKRNVPILTMFFSIGFAFWIVLFLLCYCIYKKNYKYILIFVPILALWLTNLASPVCGEFRYMYSLFTCLPIYFSVIYINKEDTNE